MSLAKSASVQPLIVTAQQLSKMVASANPPRLLDASWFLNPPGAPARDGHSEFLRGPRIPNSYFWDVDAVATRGASVRDLPHMMPSAEVFARAAREHGISRQTPVVVFDRLGIFSAPRTVFTFKAFGHEQVSILDGGFPAWVDAGLPLDTEQLTKDPPVEPVPEDAYPTPTLLGGWVRSFEEMLHNTTLGPRAQSVLDARPKVRFDGQTPEPRPGLASGHIPGSKSLPFPSVLTEHTTSNPRLPDVKYSTFREQHELWKAVDAALGGGEQGIEKLRHDASAGDAVGVSLSCGSGMTAAILWLALQQLGIDAGIYDESWLGWGRRAAEGGAPVETS